MNRARFRAELCWRLFWRYPSTQIREILEDYDVCYEEGLAQGESEQQLCARFGEPRRAAWALIGEDERYSCWPGIRKLIGIVLLFTVLYTLLDGRPYVYMDVFAASNVGGSLYLLGSRLTLVAVTPLAMRLVARTLALPPRCVRRAGWVLPVSGLLYVYALGGPVSIFFLIRSLPQETFIWPWTWALREAAPAQYGPHMYGLLCYGMLAVMAALVLQILFMQGTKLQRALCFWNMGLFLSLTSYQNMLFRMSDASTVVAEWMTCLIPLLFGLALAVVSAAVLAARHRGRPGGDAGSRADTPAREQSREQVRRIMRQEPGQAFG